MLMKMGILVKKKLKVAYLSWVVTTPRFETFFKIFNGFSDDLCGECKKDFQTNCHFTIYSNAFRLDLLV